MRKILSDEDLIIIRQLYREGYTQTYLAKEYKVSVMTISLWVKPNPYEIIRKKIKKRYDYTQMRRCNVCTKILWDDKECDCTEKKVYFSQKYGEVEDLKNILEKETTRNL